MKRNVSKLIDAKTFYPPVILTLIIIAFGLFANDTVAQFSTVFITGVEDVFGAFMNIMVNVIVFFLIVFAFTKYGNIVIGGKKAVPFISKFNWFMITLTGVIGVGIVFWGVAEPIYHFSSPNPMWGVEPGTAEAGLASMAAVFVDWALHPYSIICIFGVVAGLAIMNNNLPCKVSSYVYPLLGEKNFHRFGSFIDGLFVFVQLMGVTTVVGLATLQITSGIEYFTGITATPVVNIVTMLALFGVVIIACVTGVKKGISICSQINFGIYVFLLVFIFIVGPSIFIINTFTDGLTNYIGQFIAGSLTVDAFGLSEGWVAAWPIFYWSWWFATATVVGIFLARIAKGRTLRQFIVVNLFLPSLFGMIWFSIFGGTAIWLDLFKDAGISTVMSEKGAEMASYAFLSNLPLSSLLVVIFLLAVILSLITYLNGQLSSFSGLTQNGFDDRSGKDPSAILKIIWGCLMAGMTIVVLFMDNIKAVQNATVATGFIAAIFSVFIIWSIMRFCKSEEKQDKKYYVTSKYDDIDTGNGEETAETAEISHCCCTGGKND